MDNIAPICDPRLYILLGLCLLLLFVFAYVFSYAIGRGFFAGKMSALQKAFWCKKPMPVQGDEDENEVK